jgi:hypothetical protein
VWKKISISPQCHHLVSYPLLHPICLFVVVFDPALTSRHMHCFVTVGTTKFEELIRYLPTIVAVSSASHSALHVSAAFIAGMLVDSALDDHASEFLRLLEKKGFQRLTLQIGHGERKPTRLMEVSPTFDSIPWNVFIGVRAL